MTTGSRTNHLDENSSLNQKGRNYRNLLLDLFFRNLRQIFQLPVSQSDIPVSEVEFFNLTISRGAIISWLWIDFWLFALAVIFPHSFSWHYLIFPVVLLISILLSIDAYFARKEKIVVARLFVVESLLVLLAPLILPTLFAPNSYPYTFIALVIGILAASIIDFWESVISLLLIALVFIFVLWKHFSAVDYGSAKIAGGYIAVLWTIGLPAAMIYVRRRLLFSVLAIDQSDELFQASEEERMAKLAVANESDPINISIHGTILNTFLLLCRSKESDFPRSAFIDQLRGDFLQLERARSGLSGTLRQEISDAISKIPNLKAEIELHVVEREINHNIYRSMVVESIREKVLNLVRHSSPSKIMINLEISRTDQISIEVISTYPNKLSASELTKEMQGQSASKSLARLMKSIGGKQKVFEKSGEVFHTFKLDPQEMERAHRRRVKNARVQGIEELGRFLMGVISIYGLAIIPGFYSLHISAAALWLLGAISLSGLISAVWKIFIPQVAWVNSILAIITLMVCRADTMICTHFEIRHWLFCAFLGTFGAAALTMHHRILRWIPLALFVIVSIGSFNNPMTNCHVNTLGEIPGIFLIILIVFFYSILRHESLAQHRRVLGEIINSSEFRENLAGALESRRELVINRAFQILDLLLDPNQEWEKIQAQAALEYDRIRTLLISSPYFDIPFHVELFDLGMRRIDEKKKSSLQIIGNPPPQMRSYFAYRKLLKTYEQLFDLPEVSITIAYENLPEIIVEIPESYYQAMSGMQLPEAEVFTVKLAPLVRN